MLVGLSAVGARLRLLVDRALARLGMREDAFLLILAGVIGVVAAAAAVGVHELIVVIRGTLYHRRGAEFLYGRGVWLLMLIPAVGGLAVGALTRFVFRE